MSTKVYGASDDLIEFKGDVYGEVNYYGNGDGDNALIMFSDSTLLEIEYGKEDVGVWKITPIQTGHLFEKIDYCFDEDADPHSDVVHFKDGLKWAYAATGEWEKVH